MPVATIEILERDLLTKQLAPRPTAFALPKILRLSANAMAIAPNSFFMHMLIPLYLKAINELTIQN
jgi:hypothetical protein